MTPCRSILLVLGLAAALTSVGRIHAATPDTRAADEAALRSADENWAKAAQTKQVAAWIAFYADDAVVQPPNDKIEDNRQDITKSIGDLLELPALVIDWQPAKVETAGSGDLGYVRGTYTASFHNPKGETVNDRGKYLEVWRKQADGNWKCIVDTWNSDLP
jgi:ketosteroid isomerase-like protein